MARIPRPPEGPNRDPTLWEYFKPWAWGAWTTACFAIGAVGTSSWAWLSAGLLWAISVAWSLNRARQRYRGNRAASQALHPDVQGAGTPAAGVTVAKWWRNRHLWFDDPRSWERRLLERLEEAEAYFEAVPLSGLRGWLHKREMRRRFADIRYHMGNKRHLRNDVRRDKLNRKMKELSRTLDLEVDMAIADDIASDETIDQLRQAIVDLNSSVVEPWEDESGEALR